jgi:hypothetical protein
MILIAFTVEMQPSKPLPLIYDAVHADALNTEQAITPSHRSRTASMS